MSPRVSTRFRLVALVLGVALPLAGLLINGAYESHRFAQQKLALQLRLLSGVVAGQLEQSVSAMEQLLAGIAKIPEVQRQQMPECSKILEALQGEFPVYNNIYTGSVQGEQVCSAIPVDKPVQFADREYFKSALGSRKPAVGRVGRGRASGRMTLPIGLGLWENGSPAGVVAVSLDLGRFIQQIAKPELVSDLVLTVWDIDGRVLARYPDNDGWAGKGVPDAPVFRAIREFAGKEGTVRASGLDGADRQHAFVHVNIQNAGLLVSASVPVADADRQLRLALWRDLGLLLALCLLVCYLAWRLADRMIRKPLLQLEAAADAVRRGQYDVRAELSHGVPELVSLSRLFDSMVKALQENVEKRSRIEHEMRIAAATLESEVNERTQALQRALREAQARADELQRQTIGKRDPRSNR